MSEQSKDITKDIEESIEYYRRIGIVIEIVKQDEEPWTVLAKHESINDNILLNRKQLYKKAKEIFNRNGIEVYIKPVVYNIKLESITVNWVEDKMKELDLNKKDLIKQTGIKKDQLLSIFQERKLNSSHRALFFYYFKLYELSRNTISELI